MLKGWVYILECSDGSYYTGSTNNMERRLAQHRCGEGAKYTKNRRPVKLVYCEEFERIDEAFYREKQVQGWSRAKKKALIDGRFDDLPKLSASTPSTRDSTGSPTSSGNEVTEPIKVTSSRNKVNMVDEPVESQLFQEQAVRSHWDEQKEQWYFSIIDVVAVLTSQKDHQGARNYWKVLKHRLLKEGNETVTNCNRLKMLAVDGKMRATDVANTEQLLRLIQSIPSPKAEPFKQWLAQVGAERIEETEDPELAFDRAMQTYLAKASTGSATMNTLLIEHLSILDKNLSKWWLSLSKPRWLSC